MAEGGVGAEVEVALEGSGVGVGGGDVAGLHRNQLFVGFEVVVGGEDSGADEFFLEDCDEVEEVFGMVVADVVECVGWDGQVVVAVAFFGSVLHHSDDAFYDVVDVGEVALAVAVVEYLYGLAFDEFVGEAEVGHIGAPCGAVDGEEA